MPIPTDTFWNIRKLNVVFAISGVALVAVSLWAVKQDYDKSWRPMQQKGRVWEAALVDERIKHLDTPELEKRIADLNKQIEDKKAELEQKDKEYQNAVDNMRKAESAVSNISFDYNNRKATVGVLEAKLQDAKTLGDTDEVVRLTNELKEPEHTLAEQGEQLAKLKEQLAENRQKTKDKAKEIDDLQKQRKKLYDDVESLKKKEEALVPKTFLAKLSESIRSAPLLQFMNPADRVRPVFVPAVRMDVSFALIDTIDRCATCHVHIDNKAFARDKVYAYLEEEMASKDVRNYRYADLSPDNPKFKLSDPSSSNPGPTAMPEFWHYWGRRLLSSASLDKAKGKVNGVFNVIGKKLEVTYQGKKVQPDVKYPPTALANPKALKPDEQERYDGIFIAAVEALYHANPADTGITTARNLALAYPGQIQQLLKTELSAEQYRQLEERYRHAMIATLNPVRERLGLKALDPSSAQLAHPKLELYVDPDSKHPMEQVGCTSCHDGSGNETDFVLSAHMPRPIWVDEKTGEPVLVAQLKKPAKAEGEGEEVATMSSMLAAIYPPGDALPVGIPSLHVDLKPKPEPEGAAVGRERPKEEVPANAPATEYIDPVTRTSGRAIPQARYWANKYESESGTSFHMVEEMWDWPMRPPEYLQANCARCHSNFHDIKEEAPVLYTGRVLFNKVGCSNCHQMDSVAPDEFEAKNVLSDGTVETVRRRVGTDLRHVPGKLSKEFVSTWIWAPKAFRPSTLMPHFFMLENSSSDEEIRRTRQEVKAITEYLFVSASPLQPKHAVPSGAKGDVERGREVFQNIGCQGCHTNLNETGEQWITTDLVKRYGLKQDEAKKEYDEMTYNQRQVYALENLGEVTATGNDQKKYADGSPMPVFMHHAPELSGIGDKLLAGRTPEQAKAWLFDWLKEPRHYSAYTVMPRLRLDDQQVTDLMEYLLSQHRANGAPKDKPSGEFDGWAASEIPLDKKKVNELVAWFLRSQYSPKKADEKAVDEAEMTLRAMDALSYVSTATDDPRPTDEAKAKEEAKTRAKERAAKMSLEERQLVFLGSKLIAHYGCMNCHTINGMEAVASPCANLSDWGQKQVSKLDFGFLDEHKRHELPARLKIPMVNGESPAAVSKIADVVGKRDWATALAANVEAAWPIVEKERADWLVQKLLNTRIYDRGRNSLEPVRKITSDGKPVLDKDGDPVLDEMAGLEMRGKPYDKLKMPTFYLNDEEVHAIATFVLSNRTKFIADAMLDRTNNDQAKRIAHGRQIVERYNCVGCHQVELNFPPVRQYFAPDTWADIAPPSLRGEGNKIQFSWLFGFLKNVEYLRPSIFNRIVYEQKTGIRMPSFPLTDEEDTAINEYFAAVSQHEARELKQRLDNVIKYVDEARKAVTQPSSTLDPEKTWPGDDWIDKETNQIARDYLKQWVLDRKLMIDASFDPAKVGPDEMKVKYREALFKARFTMKLYDAPYPFMENPHPEQGDPKAVEKRFEQGEALFTEMQCLKCHFVGDINAAGGNNKPTAPNLALAGKRLQRRWVHEWVQEPNIIQLGTKMPAFFTGLPIYDLHGQPWPLGGGGNAEDTQKVMKKYDTSDMRSQKNLLLDYVFETGQRPGYFAKQPPEVATQPATAPAPK
jgi:cytochrome c551/c552